MKAADAGISISLRELDWWKLSDAVHSGEFDLAIGELSEANKNPDLVKEPFPEREGSIIVRAGHQLAGRNQVTLEEIARFPLAGPRLPGRIAQLLPPTCGMGALSEDGQFFIPVIECATPRSMIDVVSASNAVCMIWPEYCAEQLKSGQMLELPVPPAMAARQPRASCTAGTSRFHRPRWHSGTSRGVPNGNTSTTDRRDSGGKC